MTSSAEEFFDGLAAEHQPLLAHTRGTLRFDVVNGDRTDEYWHLTVDKGSVAVSHEDAPADSVVRMDRDLFENVTCGRANAMAAALRGEVGIEGDPEVLMRFQRVFPGPTKDGAS